MRRGGLRNRVGRVGPPRPGGWAATAAASRGRRIFRAYCPFQGTD